MLVTAVGIYGYLSKGHFEQKAPLVGINLQIVQREQYIAQIERDNSRLQIKTEQLDRIVDAYIKNDRVTTSVLTRKEQELERNEIQKQLNANTKEIIRITDELLPLRLKTNDIDTSLGPIKYVAALFGLQDTSQAIRMLILLLMFSFDPLAIVLILSSSITLREYFATVAVNRRNTTASSILIPPLSLTE